MRALAQRLSAAAVRGGARCSAPSCAPPHATRLFSGAASAPSSQQSSRLSPLSIALFVPSAVTGCLAYWQWERHAWKENLIESRAKMLDSPAKDVFELQDLQETQKVCASGRLVHGRSIFVGPRPRSLPGLGIQNGYFLITPLYDPVRKGAVLVNRGWVPASWNEDIEKIETSWDSGRGDEAQPEGAPSSSQAQPQPEKKSWFSWGSRKSKTDQPGAGPSSEKPTVHVVGMLQQSEQPSAVIPDNKPESLEFHWIDVPALARTVGLPADTPLIQRISDDPASQQQLHKGSPLQQAREASFSSPSGLTFPIPKNSADLVTFYTMPKDHLIYMGIWSSLCVVLGLMARHALRKDFRVAKKATTDNHAMWDSVRGQQ